MLYQLLTIHIDVKMRARSDFDDMEHGAKCDTNAVPMQYSARQFQPNEALRNHCRDVFHIWGQSHVTGTVPATNTHNVNFAPV